MIYAVVAIGSMLLVAAGGLVWLVDRTYRGDLRAALERAEAAEARAEAAESRALAAQPDRVLDALATPDERLLDAVFGPERAAGWSTSVESASGPVAVDRGTRDTDPPPTD